MSSYVEQVLLGPTTTGLVGKGKGDFANRANCAASQAGNSLKTLAQDAVVIGGTVAGASAVAKSGTIANFISKGVNCVVNGLKKLLPKAKSNEVIQRFAEKTIKNPTKFSGKLKTAGLKIGNQISKVLDKVSKASPKAKALAVVLGLGAAALSHISHKHYYKMGQIDQKYTDRAAVEKQMTKAF